MGGGTGGGGEKGGGSQNTVYKPQLLKGEESRSRENQTDVAPLTTQPNAFTARPNRLTVSPGTAHTPAKQRLLACAWLP